MTALVRVAALLRVRFPADDDRLQRIARKQRISDPRSVSERTLDEYYIAWAIRIAGSWLAELNEDELELRLDLDQSAMLDCDEEDEEERAELLRLTLAEVSRRGLGRDPHTPWRTRAQLSDFIKREREGREVFAVNPRVPDWRRP